MDELDILECPIELKKTAEAFVHLGDIGCGEDTFAIEEAAEYIQALCKLKRYLHEKPSLYESNAELKQQRLIAYSKQDLAQEMAHVYLTLNHMRIVYGISLEEIQSFMDIKIAKYGFRTYRGVKNGT